MTVPFDELDPPGQIAAAAAELDALSARLDDMLTRLRGIRVEVSDPDGMIRLTLGDDGRLLELWIADAAPTRWTNTDLEDRLNDLIRLGNDAVSGAHTDIMDSYGTSDTAAADNTYAG